MVNTPKSSSNNHSPKSAPSSAPSGDTNGPNFMRKTLPSPWAQVVRGGETESPTGIHQSLPSSSSSSSSSLTTGANDQAPSSDCSPKAVSTPPLVDNLNTIASDVSDGNAGRSKKSAWNKPSNGVVETGPVMGAESWPALSESTKFSGKLPAESSSKSAAVDGSPSTSQGPVISHPPQRQGTSNTKFSSATIYNMQNRPRPVKRVAGINIGPGPVQGNFSSPPTPPPLPPFPIYQLTPGSYGNMVPSISDSSSRYHYRNNNCDARPLVGDSSRRSNFGSHPRGNSFYHQNTYSKDRGNRDSHAPQQRMPPRGLLRHPPPSPAAFFGPQPIGPFPNQVTYPELYYFPTVTMDPFRGMPFFPHNPSPATFFPAAESPLSNMIVNQIDYYFSDTNLVKDEFLRSNMDEEGWVPITLIANFPRVRNLTSNVQLILDSMRISTVVDVHDDKLRRRNDWMNWLPSTQVKTDSSSVSSGSRYSNLTDDFQTITLEKTTPGDEGESSCQSPLPLSNGSEVAGNVN